MQHPHRGKQTHTLSQGIQGTSNGCNKGKKAVGRHQECFSTGDGIVLLKLSLRIKKIFFNFELYLKADV